MTTTLQDIINLIGYECDLLAIMQDLSNYLEEYDETAYFTAEPSWSNIEEYVNQLSFKDIEKLIDLLEDKLVNMLLNRSDSNNGFKIKLYKRLLKEEIICAL
jgi:hypothetical protein